MKGVLLAAGAGTRFWPFAEARNKCATQIAGKAAARWMADALIEAGCDGLIVVLGEKAQSVRAALQGLSVPIVWQTSSPTEGGAAAALRALEGLEEDQVAIAYGDVVCAASNVRRVIETAREGDCPAVLAAPLAADEDPRDSIGLRIREGRVREVVGHPRSRLGHSFGGVVAGDRRVLLGALEANPGIFTNVEVGGMPPVESDLAMSVGVLLGRHESVAAVEAGTTWTDLDKPWDILAASERMVRALLEGHEVDSVAEGCRIDDSAEIDGRVVLAPGASIGKRCVVRGGLILGAGSRLENGAIVEGPILVGREARIRHYCLLGGPSLGDECVVSHGAEFEGVAFERAYFYHYCEIAGVVGACVDIGAATVCGTLRFDDGDKEHRVKGRRERPRHGANSSYFGDYSRTGVNAILLPGVKIGAWSCVGPGVILRDDLPSRKACFVKQEHTVTEWGPERYGW